MTILRNHLHDPGLTLLPSYNKCRVRYHAPFPVLGANVDGALSRTLL